MSEKLYLNEFLAHLPKTKIRQIEYASSDLQIVFEDCSLHVSDDQDCCESRYFHTDDDLDYFTGATISNIELLYGPDIEDGSDCHEQAFLHFRTDKGTFTFEMHNEHNGFYGGIRPRFSLRDN